jgi:ADP-ribose pyrophosphatase
MRKKIPAHAKKVYTGIMHDVYNWEQHIHGKHYKTYEAVRKLDTVVVFASVGNKVLLAKEKRIGTPIEIGAFGGIIERGEKPLHAAKRELLEESGHASKNWKFLAVWEHPNVTIDQRNYFFAAADCKKVDEPRLEDGEFIKPLTMGFDRMVSMSSKSKKFNRYIGNYLREISKSKRSEKNFKAALFASEKKS